MTLSTNSTSQTAEAIKALFPSAAAYSNDILIRGDQAARATPIDLVQTHASPIAQQAQPVGPWADELEQTREQARMTGFAQGREEGHNLGLKEGRAHAEREAEQQVAMITAETEAKVNALNEVVQTTMDSLTAGFAEQIARISDEASSSTVELALEIAEAVLGHQVAAADDPGAAAIARCLELAPASGELNAHLNPEDLMILGDVPSLEGRKLTLTPDSSLQRGDAIVTVNEATIDARLSESLRRVAEALR
jgi:flagellar assembly protein FliH